ncbi:MAG: polysaccharide pyruvyl transferase family protein [Salinisphaera sp.]|uniref:polysaccharide pyruvyl transferase family protein n=1 Tax=Salinisphaera sp. TaxID=1914330 RepID=UPI003C7D2E4A
MLATQLDRLKQIIPAGRPVVYFDYAVYGNVGDLLIHKASDHFFQLNRNRILDAYNLQNYAKALNKRLPREAIIVFQGGGNLGDLYPRHDRLRFDVLRAFPDHRAVILPQTAYYENKRSARDTVQAYCGFENLTVCLRDRRSLDLFLEAGAERIELLPDMAHVLDGSAFVAAACNGARPVPHGDLNFMRQPWRIEDAQDEVCPFDLPTIEVWNWPEYLTEREKRRIRFARKLHRWDGKRVHSSLPWRLWRRSRDLILSRAVHFFAGHERIHTNRLHGGIFGLLCDRDIVFYDTGYGKLAGYYETWLSDDQRADFAGAVRRAEAVV